MVVAFRLFFLEKSIFRARSRKCKATKLYRLQNGLHIPLSTPEAELLFNEVTNAYYSYRPRVSIHTRITELACRANVSALKIFAELRTPRSGLYDLSGAKGLAFCRKFNLNPAWLLGKQAPTHPFVPIPLHYRRNAFRKILATLPLRKQKVNQEALTIRTKLLDTFKDCTISRMLGIGQPVVVRWHQNPNVCKPRPRLLARMQLAHNNQLPHYQPQKNRTLAQIEIAYLTEMGYQLPPHVIQKYCQPIGAPCSA